MNALRERTVQLLQLAYELELLRLHLFYMIHSSQDSIYLLDEVLTLLYCKHTSYKLYRQF
jgi:hypothetical protein